MDKQQVLCQLDNAGGLWAVCYMNGRYRTVYSVHVDPGSAEASLEYWRTLWPIEQFELLAIRGTGYVS